MQQIEIDFDVFKELTARRRSENHTYNQVLRELLDLGTAHPGMTDFSEVIRAVGKGIVGGFESRGLFLPNGTLLRAKYKGRHYKAAVEQGRFCLADGKSFGSPSAAAKEITGNNVNGLRFWEAKRPSDSDWARLDSIAS